MRNKTVLSFVLIVSLVAGIGWMVLERLPDSLSKGKNRQQGTPRAVSVEVAPIRQAPISLWRHYTGSIEAHAEFLLSSKVDGRIVSIVVELGDQVTRDDVVASIDDAELSQSLARAEADMKVAEANLAEANSLLVIAGRDLKRLQRLNKQ